MIAVKELQLAAPPIRVQGVSGDCIRESGTCQMFYDAAVDGIRVYIVGQVCRVIPMQRIALWVPGKGDIPESVGPLVEAIALNKSKKK